MVLLPWVQYVRVDGPDKTLRLSEEPNRFQGTKASVIAMSATIGAHLPKKLFHDPVVLVLACFIWEFLAQALKNQADQACHSWGSIGCTIA